MCHRLCDILRQNGSLHRISIQSHYRDRTWFDGKECLWFQDKEGLVKAFCERNIDLPMRMSRPLLYDFDEDVTPGNKAAIVPLFPTLFAAGKQAPALSPHFIFTGLIALCQSVGPKNSVGCSHDRKRVDTC